MLLKGPRFSARPSPTWHFWLGNALSERPLNCARESIKTVKDLRRITLNDQPHILLPRFEQGPKKNLYLSPTSYGPTVCADYIGRINICIACLAVWWWLIAHMCGSFPYHVCICVSQGPCVSDKRTWCVLFMPNDHTTRTKNKRMGFFSVCRAYYMLFLGFVDHFTFCVRIFFRQPPPPGRSFWQYGHKSAAVGWMSLFIWGYLSVMFWRSYGTRTSWLAWFGVRAKGGKYSIIHLTFLVGLILNWYYHNALCREAIWENVTTN